MMNSWERLSHNTVGCRYNAVHYNTILHTSLQEGRQDINESLDPQKTPHTLTGELWGVFCEHFGEIWPRYKGIALKFDPGIYVEIIDFVNSASIKTDPWKKFILQLI